jgi:methylated-DNA-[protein]-cysteine S-methyltransferase
MTLKEKVYSLTSQIPEGRVSTYKAIGDAIGTKAYRAIGQILAVNPYAPKVPCHRVVKSNGEIGGFMGDFTHSNKKVELLSKEGVNINSGRVLNFDNVNFSSFNRV